MNVDEMVARCEIALGTDGLADQFRALTTEHRRVLAQRCRNCSQAQFPPLLACAACNGTDLWWADVGGSGVVTHWVTVHTAETTPAFTVPRRLGELVPYATVFVQPDAVDGVFRIPTFMTGPRLAELEHALPVNVSIVDVAGRPLAVVEPAAPPKEA